MSLKQAIRNAVLAGAKSRGYDLVPFWKMDEVPLANHLRKVFERHDIQIVLDVGANKGQYHDLLRNDVGFKGRIISFEPVRKYVDLLTSRLPEDPGWTLFNFALGREEAVADINVTQSPGLNSFLAPRTDVVENYWHENSIESVEQVRIRSLDDVLAEAGIDCAASSVYLKLDTQGFDLEVIAGASRTLPAIRALQTEASIRPIYQEMPTYSETIARMNDNGFELSGMFPVTHDSQLRLVELDLVFLNGIHVE